MLCEHPLNGAAQPGTEPVVLLLPLGFALAVERRGHQVLVEPVVALVGQGGQAELGLTSE